MKGVSFTTDKTTADRMVSVMKQAIRFMNATTEEEARQGDTSVLDWVFEEESNMSREARYELNEEVLIHRLRDHPLKGVVTCIRPLRAKVTDPDKVFHGAETTDGIRKINPQIGIVGKKRK